jgi:Na+/H+-translocating membrane pyrophosphatase
LQGLVFPQGDDQNAKNVVVNIGDDGGVARDAFDCYLTLFLTTMTKTMVIKYRYKALATIIITSIRDELIPHIVDEEDPCVA